MTKLANPVPIFLDASGALADGGYIYVGVANGNPVTQPIQVYFDPGFTIPASQPLRTMGGVIVNGATPTNVFVNADDYSMQMADLNGNQVFYSPSVYLDTDAFQPRNANLDTLAAENVTPFGAGLLALANPAALANATGIPTPLPAAGGTVTGDIKRQAAGVYMYWNDPGMIFGNAFLAPASGNDPTSQPGQIWFQY